MRRMTTMPVEVPRTGRMMRAKASRKAAKQFEFEAGELGGRSEAAGGPGAAPAGRGRNSLKIWIFSIKSIFTHAFEAVPMRAAA